VQKYNIHTVLVDLLSAEINRLKNPSGNQGSRGCVKILHAVMGALKNLSLAGNVQFLFKEMSIFDQFHLLEKKNFFCKCIHRFPFFFVLVVNRQAIGFSGVLPHISTLLQTDGIKPVQYGCIGILKNLSAGGNCEIPFPF